MKGVIVIVIVIIMKGVMVIVIVMEILIVMIIAIIIDGLIQKMHIFVSRRPDTENAHHLTKPFSRPVFVSDRP
jgi:hypothetical protein